MTGFHGLLSLVSNTGPNEQFAGAEVDFWGRFSIVVDKPWGVNW